MVKKYLLSIATAMILTLSFTSCDKWIDPELNIDPDAALEVPNSLLLPSIEQRMGYTFGNMDVTGVTSMWVQYTFGAARQAAILGSGNITEAGTNNLWNSLYNGGMMDAKVLIDQAADAPAYSGVAKILMALYLGQTTDLFGDIPYTEAFLGLENLNPAYDTQESIYASIQALLTAGIADLNAAATSPENDFFYGGDKAQWIKAAYSLKARYAIHLSARNASYATEALGFIANGMASNDDDLTFWFGTSPTEQAPIFQFNEQRGDMAQGAYFFDLLEAENDPREFIFESHPDYNDNEVAGIYYGAPDGPVEIMTYTELMYIKAEAHFANGEDTEAKDALKVALNSSLDKYRGLVEAYDDAVDAFITTKEAEIDAATLDLEYIIMAKYAARFLSPETYTDYRRTGIPALVPTGSTIPKRFPYPTNERLYNESTPSKTIQNEVWWDND